MIAFLDTSCLIKLYIAEAGSQALKDRLQNTDIAVSQLTYAETFATFARRLREGLLTADEHRELCDAFGEDWEDYVRIRLGDAVLIHVPGLCHRYPLRGADAMQLACAVMLRKENLDVVFMTSDQRLLAAARAEGLAIFDPENP